MRNYLRALRKNKNLSQCQVSDVIGISQQHYSLIENGDRQKKMDIELIQKLANVFNVSVEYIIAQEIAIKQTA